MNWLPELLLCTAALAQLHAASGAQCYNGTHDSIQPRFPDGMNKCESADGWCHEILHQLSKSMRIILGCGKCPSDMGGKGARISVSGYTAGGACSSTDQRLSNDKKANEIKSSVLNAKLCPLADDDGPKGTILCDSGQKCLTAVSAGKTMFRGCASNCQDSKLKLSDCRECDSTTGCEHAAFDANGKFKAGSKTEAQSSAAVIGALVVILAQTLAL